MAVDAFQPAVARHDQGPPAAPPERSRSLRAGPARPPRVHRDARRRRPAPGPWHRARARSTGYRSSTSTPGSPIARRRSCGSCGCPASCSAGLVGATLASRAPPTRACSATRSPTLTCSASRPAPDSGATHGASPTARRTDWPLDPLPLAAFVGGSGRRRADLCPRASAGVRASATLILAGVAVAAFLTAAADVRPAAPLRDTCARCTPGSSASLTTAGWDEVGLILPLRGGRRRPCCCAPPAARRDARGRRGGRQPRRPRRPGPHRRGGGRHAGTAAAVSVSGLIAFVGIIVPHTVRLLVGAQLPARAAAVDRVRRRVPDRSPTCSPGPSPRPPRYRSAS